MSKIVLETPIEQYVPSNESFMFYFEDSRMKIKIRGKLVVGQYSIIVLHAQLSTERYFCQRMNNRSQNLAVGLSTMLGRRIQCAHFFVMMKVIVAVIARPLLSPR